MAQSTAEDPLKMVVKKDQNMYRGYIVTNTFLPFY
jgi:hypothetical protein